MLPTFEFIIACHLCHAQPAMAGPYNMASWVAWAVWVAFVGFVRSEDLHVFADFFGFPGSDAQIGR